MSKDTMENRTNDPLCSEEAAHVFSDRAVAKLVVRIGLTKCVDVQRLAKGMRSSASRYASDVHLPTPNSLRREIAHLQHAARGRRYKTVARVLAQLSDTARELLKGRAAVLSDRPWPDQPARASLPKPEELHDADRRDDACDLIHVIATMGGYSVDGRRRSTGKQDREWRVRLYAPKASRAEPRRRAERSFVRLLRANYFEATGCMPPNTAQHFRPGPFARLAGECLRLLGAPTNDPDDDRTGLAVQLINDLDHERRRRNSPPGGAAASTLRGEAIRDISIRAAG
jgi:hypothetical protein